MSSTPASSSSTEKFRFTAEQVRHFWRLTTISGALGGIYGVICVDGNPRAKFLTEMNATAFDFALISALASFAYIFQIICGLVTRHMRSRKTLWAILGILNRVLFLGVFAAPLLFEGDRTRIWCIITVIFIAQAAGHASLPIWYAWMAELVPRETLNRHWASRQRYTTGVRILASLSVAVVFYFLEKYDWIMAGYGILGIVGVAIGVADILIFLRIPEPEPEQARRTPLLPALLQPLRDRQFRPFLIYSSYWQIAVMVAAPFFAPFVLQKLHISAFFMIVVFTMETVGIVVASRFWGLLCDTYGQRPILQMGVFGKAVITLSLFLVPPIPAIAIPLLAIAFFLNGLLTASTMLGMQGILLKYSPRENRSTYIGVANFISGSTAAIVSLLAGYLLKKMDAIPGIQIGVFVFGGYHLVFALSTFLRLSTYYMAGRLYEPTNISVREILSHLKATNPLTITRLVYRLTESGSAAERVHACRRLARLKSPLAIKELIRCLDDDSERVRSSAAEALGKIGHAEACEPLARALGSGQARLEGRAARALGAIGGFNSLKALLANLRGLSPKALEETVDALARINDSAAILPLICLYEEAAQPRLRARILAALGKLGQIESPEEVETLFQPAAQQG